MLNERQPYFIIATGIKAIGKTYTTCQMIQEYITPYPGEGRKARKVLIYDVNREYENEVLIKKGFRWRSKVLALKDLPLWTMQSKIEVRRILPVDEFGNTLPDKKIIENLSFILDNFKGGLLVLEDLNRYMITTSTVDIIGLLISNRHRDLDVVTHLQSAAPISPRMWQNVNWVRFHHQNDSVVRIKERIPYELFQIAQILVDNEFYKGSEEGKRFYAWINKEMERVSGRFSQNMFRAAVKQYLELYNKSLVVTEQNKFKKDANAYSKALANCTELLVKKYYGN